MVYTFWIVFESALCVRSLHYTRTPVPLKVPSSTPTLSCSHSTTSRSWCLAHFVSCLESHFLSPGSCGGQLHPFQGERLGHVLGGEARREHARGLRAAARRGHSRGLEPRGCASSLVCPSEWQWRAEHSILYPWYLGWLT